MSDYSKISRLEKTGRIFGLILSYLIFVFFAYFLFFRENPQWGLFSAVVLVFFVCLLGRLIRKIIYGRNSLFF